ncbi:MAG: hypothetical protein AB7K68_14360 [Bacteriovoracia bacterium]
MNFKKLALLAALASLPAQAAIDTTQINWEPDLLPSLYLDFGSTTRIVNLSPGKSLAAQSYSQGFRVVNTSVRALGVGAEYSLNSENTTGLSQGFFVSVGLRPIVGREVKSISYARDLRAVDKILEERALPRSAQDLRLWANGDSVSYATKGGVLFFGGAGFVAASVTATILAQGEFQTHVEKLDASHVLVKLTDSHLDAVGLQVGNVIADLGTKHFSKIADSLSYRIDISTPAGAKTFESMIQGNIAAAQKLAATSDTVRPYQKSTLQQVGNLNTMYIGVPVLLNTKLSAGKVRELNLTRSLRNNTLLRTHYGIYLNEQKTNALTEHHFTTEAFYGSSFRLTHNDSRPIKSGYFGQYFWSFENNKASGASLTDSMKEIARKTGLRLLVLQAPKGEDLGYASVSLRAQFGEAKMKRIMDVAQRMPKPKMLGAVLSMIDTYLNTGKGDVDGVCANYEGECSLALVNETIVAISEMHEAANEMAQADSDQAYAEASARFGKAMMANQFTFRTAVLLAGSGVQLDYIVEGRDLSRQILTLESTGNPGQLFVRSQRGLITEGALYRDSKVLPAL